MLSEYSQPPQLGETMPRSTLISHADFVNIGKLVPTFSTGTGALEKQTLQLTGGLRH
jgi:hypothetical protein